MATIPLQQTFDTVVEHLRKQGKRAYENGRGCRYRTFDGLKCAAGCLLPDEKYSASFEGNTVMQCTPEGMQPSGVGILIEELGHDLQLVGRLQSIHDGMSQHEWEGAFEHVAKKLSLIYTPPVPA